MNVVLVDVSDWNVKCKPRKRFVVTETGDQLINDHPPGCHQLNFQKYGFPLQPLSRTFPPKLKQHRASKSEKPTLDFAIPAPAPAPAAAAAVIKISMLQLYQVVSSVPP